MGKAAAGTPKGVANAMKAKGLGRLRWYCQVCQKQCRDDNGFKCHIATEAHLRQMLVVGEAAGKHIDEFSLNFKNEFITLLSRRYNTKRIRANQVYQEYIQDKHHIHMNATQWATLTEFVKYLGKEGIVRVDENEKGFWISWIDNSPGALARQDAILKKERQDTDDEQRQRKLLAEQIARAQEAGSGDASAEPTGPTELVRDPETKISLSFGALKKPSPPADDTTSPPASSTVPAQVKLGFSNPLKRPAPVSNVFKSSKKAAASPSRGSSAPGQKISAAEQLIRDEEARKARMGDRGAGGFVGGKRLKL